MVLKICGFVFGVTSKCKYVFRNFQQLYIATKMNSSPVCRSQNLDARYAAIFVRWHDMIQGIGIGRSNMRHDEPSDIFLYLKIHKWNVSFSQKRYEKMQKASECFWNLMKGALKFHRLLHLSAYLNSSLLVFTFVCFVLLHFFVNFETPWFVFFAFWC